MTATRSRAAPSLALTVAIISALALGFAAIGSAQNAFPTRPIKMLVGFAAGGGTDVAARVIAQPMSEILGQTIVVEDRHRRQRLARFAGSGEIGSRRLHADDGQPDHLRGGAGALSQGDGRSGQGFRRRRAHRRLAARPGGQSVVRRAFGRGRDRDGEGQPRQNQFRHRRRRHDAAHDRRTVSSTTPASRWCMSPIAAKPARSTIFWPGKFRSCSPTSPPSWAISKPARCARWR